MLNLKNLPDGFHDDPWAHYARLRETAPACVQPDGSILLTRHADLCAIYRDTERFVSDKKPVFGPKYGIGSPLFRHHTTSLVFNDAPLHTRVRAIIAGALTPRALARLEPGLIALVDGLLDRLEGRRDEGSPADLIDGFAAAIPVEVIGNLFAIPHAARGPLRDWSLAILGALEPVLTPEAQARGDRAVTDFTALLTDLVADRRRHPGDPGTDVLTGLAQGTGSAALTAEELHQNCIFILNAGHETTTNLIGNGLALLDTHRDVRAALLADPSLLPGAVEEILRLESSNQFGNRLTAAPLALHGIDIAPGTDLHLCIGAANRDPDAFAVPERFDPARRPNRHLAFGGGPHTCVGLTLARMEGTVALGRFLGRFPGYALTSGAVRSRRIRFRGFTRLPARLS